MSEPDYINMMNGEHYDLSFLWRRAGPNLTNRFEEVIFYFSYEKNNIETALMEWSIHNFEDSGNSYCICSHIITREFYVIHRITKSILRIGSDCIEKFGHKEMKLEHHMLATQLNYKNNGSGAYRMCSSCMEHKIFITENSETNRCRRCIKYGLIPHNLLLLEGKKCIKCNKQSIYLKDNKEICNYCEFNIKDIKNGCMKCYDKSINFNCSSCKMRSMGFIEERNINPKEKEQEETVNIPDTLTSLLLDSANIFTENLYL